MNLIPIAPQPRGGLDFVFAGVQAAVTDVLQHGAGEEIGVLQHDAELPTKLLLGDLPDVNPVDADVALTS